MLSQLIKDPTFIQFVGFIALIFALLVFQAKKRDGMLKLHILASGFFAIHYFLLGAYSGSAINTMNILRNYSFSKFKKKKNSWLLPAIFIVLFIIIGIVSWQGWISLLPILSAVGGTIAFWQSKPKIIRILSFIILPMWFIYDALSGSYPGMIAEFIIFTSDIVGLCRYDIFKNRKKLELRINRKILHP